MGCCFGPLGGIYFLQRPYNKEPSSMKQQQTTHTKHKKPPVPRHMPPAHSHSPQPRTTDDGDHTADCALSTATELEKAAGWASREGQQVAAAGSP